MYYKATSCILILGLTVQWCATLSQSQLDCTCHNTPTVKIKQGITPSPTYKRVTTIHTAITTQHWSRCCGSEHEGGQGHLCAGNLSCFGVLCNTLTLFLDLEILCNCLRVRTLT